MILLYKDNKIAFIVSREAVGDRIVTGLRFAMWRIAVAYISTL